MRLTPTDLPEVIVIEPELIGDERGWFMESYNEARLHAGLAALGRPAPPPFVQENHSSSKRGVLRGLNFQLPPQAQGRLVRIVRGAAFDVAVDIRPGSPRFGRWAAVELSAANRRQLWVPAGFAHGALMLEDDTELVYRATTYYAPSLKRSILWSDPQIGLAWPAIDGGYALSDKDAAGLSLAEAVAELSAAGSASQAS